jgi:hypothetical protein
MPNYQNGQIYKVVNTENDIVYIGSTCQKLSQRMRNHRCEANTRAASAFYRAMRDIGIDKFSIVLIKDVPCFNKAQLETQEFKVMAGYKLQKIQLYNFCTSLERTGSGNGNFKRGSVIRSTGANQNQSARWRFRYQHHGRGEYKSFSVKKYGEDEAKAMAIAAQDEMYPLPVQQNEEYKVNKSYAELRVSQKMGEIKSELAHLEDLGRIEHQAAEELRDYYDHVIMIHYKRLEKYKGTDQEQKMRNYIKVIQYAQEVAARYRVTIEYSPQAF